MSMEAMNLIKEKRNGNTKDRTCANGSDQRQFLKQDKSVALPTTCLIVDSFIIVTHEGENSQF